MSGRTTLRAGIVVTGTEVLTGRVADRNGPWLAERLLELGVDVGRILVVGDRPEDLSAALAHLADDHDLVITTGGLGPTADDLTARVVGDFQGRASHLDAGLEQRVTAIVAGLTSRHGWRTNPDAVASGVRKQAMVPDGAVVLEPVGTAPGLVVPPAADRSGPPVVVLPGPPGELRPMWDEALAAEPVRAVLARATALRQRTLRLWRTLEADLAATLRDLDGQIDGLEITTCLQDGELEVVTRYAPDLQDRYDLLQRTITTVHAATVFSVDGSTVDDVVARSLVARGWTVATAESCTGGLLAGRLTARPGSSSYVVGGLVVYANEAKSALAGVPIELIATQGAVSREVAEALAEGARTALGTDVGIGVTGIAGPDGGTPDKPVGTVHLALITPDGGRHRLLRLGGGRAGVRQRTVVAALHELRLLLSPVGEASEPREGSDKG